MIKINLLPLEKRKAERTPLPRFGLILANVAAAAAIVCIVIVELIRIAVANSDISTLEGKSAALDKDAKAFDVAFDLNTKLKAKASEVESISGSPVEWWKVIDALWDVIHDNPKIWLDDITMLDAGAAKTAATSYDPATTATPPFGLSFACHASGLDVSVLTKFRNDLRLKELLRRTFQEINFNPEWQTAEHDEYAEKFSLSFKVQMIGATPAAPAPPAAPAAPPKTN
jgi:hypothetical protein